MKKHSPVFGILFAVVVAAIFLAVSFPNNKTAKNLSKDTESGYYQYY